MAYFHKVLRPDEVVHYEGHLHWLAYLRGISLLVLAVAIYIIAHVADMAPTANIAFQLVAGLIAAVALFSLAAAAIRRATTEIVVTDRRVIYKTGLISR